MDATKFNKASDQFHTSVILRELNKAYVGFHSNLAGKLAPVATGNWGCGAFRGDPNLKALIQLMACSAANRNMVYYTFGNVDLEKTIYDVYAFLANNKVTVSELWRSICRFIATNNSQHTFIPYIQQSFIDMHKQPTIMQFFKDSDSTRPSTSSEMSAKNIPTKSNSNSKEKKPSGASTSMSTGDLYKFKKSPTKLVSANNTDRKSPKKINSVNADLKTMSVDNAGRQSPVKIYPETAPKGDNKDVVDIIRIIDEDVKEPIGEDIVKESLLSMLDNVSTYRVESAEGHCESVENEAYPEM
ncbi:hypothetical protein AMK59_3985, partial [Oryctes borbonicus]